MRIIHTGDWHLNHKLGRIDMTEQLQIAIGRIAGYLKTKHADVLIIAGDLFCGRESRSQLQTSLEFLKKTFSPFLAEGGTILTISGNHDSEAFFLTLRDAFDLVSPAREGIDGVHASGRLYIAPNPRVIKLRGHTGQVVQFALMPFPTSRAYLLGEGTRYKSIEEKNTAVASVYHQTLNKLITDKIDMKLPSVLISHAQIRGVPISDLFVSGDEHDVLIDLTTLLAPFAYGAFGHIHRPGAIGQGGTHFRYCGSLLPLDAGEAGQEKSVVLIEVAQKGCVGEPELLPLEGARLLDITIPASEIDKLSGIYPNHKSELVKYRLRYDVEEHPDPFPLHQEIRAIFPFWYESLNEPYRQEDGDKEVDTGSVIRTGLDLKNLLGNVRDYLEKQAKYDGNDASGIEVLALVDTLFANQSLVEALQDAHTTEKQVLANVDLMTAFKGVCK